MTTKYFRCEICNTFTPLSDKRRASKYCGRSCRGKAYYRRRKANEPYRYHLRGLSYHPLYQKWEDMRARCNNPSSAAYPDYGGRGIKVCKLWDDAAKYIVDIEALGPRPGAGYSIDRIDNDGNYEPGNVRWLDQSNQNFNQRTRRTNSSGHRGVSWDVSRSKWSALLSLHGKNHYGGRFETREEAIKARHDLQLKYKVVVRCCS